MENLPVSEATYESQNHGVSGLCPSTRILKRRNDVFGNWVFPSPCEWRRYSAES
jgi:hypothetical protein